MGNRFVINLHNLANIIIYTGALATALIAMGILLRWVVVRPLKRWISEEIREPLANLKTQISIVTKRFDDHLLAYHSVSIKRREQLPVDNSGNGVTKP